MAYLEDRPTTIKQYRAPRRERPVGIIGVHTAENVMDSIGPDTGAENVAAFIAKRADPGSYHDLADADSIVSLVSHANEAFHIATHRLNRRTTGLSFACRTVDWARMSPERRRAFIRNGATAAVRQALYHRQASGIVVPPRQITLAQALNGDPGFLAHASADPGRRSDPGADFPWGEFLAEFSRQWNAATGVVIVPPTPAPVLTRRSVMFFVRRTDQPYVWVTDGIIRRYVPNPAALERLQGVARWGLVGAERDAATTIYLVDGDDELSALAGYPAPDGIGDGAAIDLDALADKVAQRSADELAARIRD